MRTLKYFIFSLLLLCACEMEYSPNQSFDEDTPRDLNKKNIEKLLSANKPGDTIRIVFIGDSQRFYDEAEAMVKKVNQLHNIDFVVHAGDISDFGMLDEFEWVDKIMSGLVVPYIAVIGNHDIVAKGDEVYERMYGPQNFSFVYKGVRFIFHDTNGREYNFSGKVPDMEWLEQQCAPQTGVDNYVAVSHVPPFDSDFDKKIEPAYSQLFGSTPGFIISLHGHLHNAGLHYPYDGIPYLNSNSFEKRQMTIVEIYNGRSNWYTIPY